MATVIKPSLKMTESDTVRMLRLYQTEPCLYDKTYSGYGVRELRMAAAKRLSDELGVPGFGPREIVSKFRNLRNAYSQELRKIRARVGRASDAVYVPTVYWFRVMDEFLRPHIYAACHAMSNSVQVTPSSYLSGI